MSYLYLYLLLYLSVFWISAFIGKNNEDRHNWSLLKRKQFLTVDLKSYITSFVIYCRQIKEQLRVYECQVKRQSSTKGKLKHIDLRLCRLCYKTKFADGIGRVCYDCRKRVCQRCGSYVRDPYNHKSSKVSSALRL